jgi:hypothetical protein
VRTIGICAVVALTVQSANAVELQVGARIPAALGETVIVGNDGGVRNQVNTFFDVGQTCRTGDWQRSWFIVKRIVGDWTLLEVEAPDALFGQDDADSVRDECPKGTQTSRLVTEMRARLRRYARQSDFEFLQSFSKTEVIPHADPRR